MKKTGFISLILAGMTLLSCTASAETDSSEYDRFEILSSYAANLYIDPEVTTEGIMEEALKSVLAENPLLANQLIKAGFQSLDEYTEYYTKEEYELFKKNIDHIVYGIGVIIQQQGDYVTVMSCTEGGGAETVGIKSGDKILRVDGVDVKGESVDKVQDLVVGELGTQVTVTLLRGEQEIEYTITRGEVRGTTVGYEILDGNIAYVVVLNFAENTSNEFVDVLFKLDAMGVTDIILDLRNNPGGYLEPAIEIAMMTVPKGPIVSESSRGLGMHTVYSDLSDAKYNFCVLINENTASSAEVLASALSDSGVGFLVGNRSYGKGVIQSMYEMWDGSAFKITTGKYFTRNGSDINGEGIEPHEYVENATRLIDLTRYKTFDYKNKPSVGSSSQNVYAAKERLRIMGYYTGEINDNFDVALEKAVSLFQEKNGLFPYGVLDVSTQVKMENLFYKIEEEVDYQLIYAYEYFGGTREALGI